MNSFIQKLFRKTPRPAAGAIAVSGLRSFKTLDGMDDSELARLLELVDMLEVKAFTCIVRAGKRVESFYLVLDGELRACVILDGKESHLDTFRVGDCFGQISLLDKDSPSADVIANKDSLLLYISSESFENLSRKEPNLALHLAFALGRALGGKMGARRPGGENPGVCYAGEPAPIKPIPTHHLAAGKELPPSDKTRSFPKD